MPTYPLDPVYVATDLMLELGPSTPVAADGHREYTHRYQVQVRSPIDEIYAVFAPGIPRIFSRHPRDVLAVVTDISAQPKDREDWGIWLVDVKYSTEVRQGIDKAPKYDDPSNPKGTQNSPELEPVEVDWDFEVVHRVPPKAADLDGNPFLNAAGQPFTPAPMFEYAYLILNLVRNELDFDHAKAARYAFSVNSDTFLGYPPRTVQCMPPKAKYMLKGPVNYARVSYKLRFGIMGDDGRPIPWDPVEILNAGLMQKKKLPLLADEILVPIYRNGRPVTQPVLLDRAGHELVVKPPFKVNANFISFRLRPAFKFKDLLKNGLAPRL